MDRFAQLFAALDTTTSTTAKIEALTAYFGSVEDEDIIWAVWLMSGNTVRRAVTTTRLKDLAAEAATIPRWMFDESYIRVGDLAETVALVLPDRRESRANVSLATWMVEIVNLRDQPEQARSTYIEQSWAALSPLQCFLFTKLITGGFRVGVARGLVMRALAQHLGIEAPILMHMLAGNWDPFRVRLDELAHQTGTDVRPYPFFLASPVTDIERLGRVGEWLVEWKWDGIRGQLVVRDGSRALWSRGEELISDQFPEIMQAADGIPEGTVLDGELMPWRDGPLPFAILQRRLGRKKVTPALLTSSPVSYIVYDLLEWKGEDYRGYPQAERRQQLERVMDANIDPHLRLSPVVDASDWQYLGELQSHAREQRAEGLMLKRLAAPYQAGRVRGDWWKWKVAPLSVDAVMIYAQRGHGRRSAVYSDYTFAVRDGEALVPFAKAYSGLTDAEIKVVDQFVKRHTVEKFGPVRTVAPELVFEIGFEGIAVSRRHKSGVAVRFPRILRPRTDKTVAEIDTVETLKQLLEEVS